MNGILPGGNRRNGKIRTFGSRRPAFAKRETRFRERSPGMPPQRRKQRNDVRQKTRLPLEGRRAADRTGPQGPRNGPSGLPRSRPGARQDARADRGHLPQRSGQHGRSRLRGRDDRPGRVDRRDRPGRLRLHDLARSDPGSAELRRLPQKRLHVRERRGLPRHPERAGDSPRRRHRQCRRIDDSRRILFRRLAHVSDRQRLARAAETGRSAIRSSANCADTESGWRFTRSRT